MIGIFTNSLSVCERETERGSQRERDTTQWAAESFHVYKQLLHTTDVFPICCILKLEMRACVCVCVFTPGVTEPAAW